MSTNYYFQTFEHAWQFREDCEARGEFSDFPVILRKTGAGNFRTRVTVYESREERDAAWREDARIEAQRLAKHGY